MQVVTDGCCYKLNYILLRFVGKMQCITKSTIKLLK